MDQLQKNVSNTPAGGSKPSVKKKSSNTAAAEAAKKGREALEQISQKETKQKKPEHNYQDCCVEILGQYAAMIKKRNA